MPWIDRVEANVSEIQDDGDVVPTRAVLGQKLYSRIQCMWNDEDIHMRLKLE